MLVRHPVDRAASMFYFLKGTGYPPLKNMTVDDYAKSELIENNWLGEFYCYVFFVSLVRVIYCILVKCTHH